jgi:hypothetical protein
MTILAGVANREIEVREGETASIDIVTRAVVVGGRVTRAGQGLPGDVVSVMGRDSGAVSAFMGMTSSAASPPQGPPPLTATTREDGGYELLVFGPGPSYVQMRSPEQSYPAREVDVPDVERYELDLEVAEASVSGVVVDKEPGTPLAEALVTLREPGPEGKWKGGGTSGPDGRFSIAAEPGEYLLEARARSRKPSTLAVTVGTGGLSDVRLEMEAGLDIRGRVRTPRDVRGGGRVYAIDAEGDARASTAAERPSLPDGSFHLSGLDARPYALVCGSERAGFAMRTGVTPGDDPVALTLRPGGRVLARVVGPDGAPATDTYLRLVSWDGVRFRSAPVGDARPTETPGVVEVAVPAGSIEIAAAWGNKTYGSATARVLSGETTSLDLVLKELC